MATASGCSRCPPPVPGTLRGECRIDRQARRSRSMWLQARMRRRACIPHAMTTSSNEPIKIRTTVYAGFGRRGAVEMQRHRQFLRLGQRAVVHNGLGRVLLGDLVTRSGHEGLDRQRTVAAGLPSLRRRSRNRQACADEGRGRAQHPMPPISVRAASFAATPIVAYAQPYYPTYYARPVYYRPYPYGVPAPFFLGFGYLPYW